MHEFIFIVFIVTYTFYSFSKLKKVNIKCSNTSSVYLRRFLFFFEWKWILNWRNKQQQFICIFFDKLNFVFYSWKNQCFVYKTITEQRRLLLKTTKRVSNSFSIEKKNKKNLLYFSFLILVYSAFPVVFYCLLLFAEYTRKHSAFSGQIEFPKRPIVTGYDTNNKK